VAVVLSAASSALAGDDRKPDDSALRDAETAISDEYRGGDHSDAVDRLQHAIKRCEKKKCSATTKARLFHDLGVVYGEGLKRDGRAIGAFKRALKEDPKIELNPDLATPRLEKLWAKAGGKKEKPKPEPPKAEKPKKQDAPPLVGVEHEPVTKSQGGYPIPIYAELESEAPDQKLQLRYRPISETEWYSEPMRSVGDGFGAEIPCKWAERGGWVDYYIEAEQGDRTKAVSGTEKEPHTVQIMSGPVDPAPSYPGESAPKACSDTAAAAGGAKAEPKPAGATPAAKPAEPEPAPPAGPPKRMWVQVSVMQDFTFVGGEDVCSYQGQNYSFYCLRSDGDQYIGVPVTGVEDKADMVPRLSTTRAVGTFRMAFGRFSVGAGVGFAFRGGWTPVGASPFLPLHAELRGSFWLPRDAFDGFGAYAFVATGIAQMDSEDKTWLEEDLNVAAPRDQPDANNQQHWEVDVLHRAGRHFGAIGIGAFLPIDRQIGVLAELRASYLFPATAFAVSPTLGAAYGF